MRRAAFFSSLLGVFLVPIGGLASADEIHLLKGKPLKDVRVLDESYEEVRYRRPPIRAEQTVDASQVKQVIYSAESETYGLAMQKMAGGDFKGAHALFLSAAGKPPSSMHWIKQYGLFNAAECLRLQKDLAGAIKGYDILLQEVEKTKFFGEVHLMKAVCYDASRDQANARKTLEALKAAGSQVGDRWKFMAEYHLTRLDERKDPKKAFDTYISLQSKAGGAGYNDVANLARLGVGYALIQQRKLDEARKYFDDIISDRQASPTAVVAGAYNGLGTCLVSKASPTNEDYNHALFLFLRTVFHYGDELGQSELVAEALYWAGRCFEEKVGDLDVNSKRSRFMYTRCVKEYPSSPWGARASER